MSCTQALPENNGTMQQRFGIGVLATVAVGVTVEVGDAPAVGVEHPTPSTQISPACGTGGVPSGHSTSQLPWLQNVKFVHEQQSPGASVGDGVGVSLGVVVNVVVGAVGVTTGVGVVVV